MKNIMSEKSYYGNNMVYYNDTLLFYTSDRKINWYMKKGLLEKVDDKKYNFLFEPNGFRDKDHIANQPILIENLCVNCGNVENLTKHHIIPASYRRHMPEHYKSHNSYDVLILCFDCHTEYEKKATIVKKELSIKYSAPIEGILDGYPHGYKELIRIINTLEIFNNQSINLPVDKKEILKMRILEFFGYIPKENKLEYIIDELSRTKLEKRLISHSELVITRLEDLDEFVYMWRKHFVDNMECLFLPKNWNINNKKVYK